MDTESDLLARLAPGARLAPENAERLANAMNWRHQKGGTMLTRQGEADTNEYILVGGRAKSTITDHDGREACLALDIGPCALAPNMARTADQLSLVDITLLDDTEVGVLAAGKLLELMVAFPDIREWGNAIMRRELERKVAREWSLSALDAAARIDWFRRAYPRYETVFPHTLIASFLGMTPVTFSRTRKK